MIIVLLYYDDNRVNINVLLISSRNGNFSHFLSNILGQVYPFLLTYYFSMISLEINFDICQLIINLHFVFHIHKPVSQLSLATAI